MLKKILLILAALIFAISCSNPSNPNGNNNTGDGGNNGNNTGNGGNTETGTTDPSKIAAFLQDKEGVYREEEDEKGHTKIKIKEGKVFYIQNLTWENVTPSITLFEDNKKIVPLYAAFCI